MTCIIFFIVFFVQKICFLNGFFSSGFKFLFFFIFFCMKESCFCNEVERRGTNQFLGESLSKFILLFVWRLIDQVFVFRDLNVDQMISYCKQRACWLTMRKEQVSMTRFSISIGLPAISFKFVIAKRYKQVFIEFIVAMILWWNWYLWWNLLNVKCG